MNYWLDMRLKIRDFFKKHKRTIYIVLIVWAIIIGINYFLKNMKNVNITPKTTLAIHEPIMNEGDKVPERYKDAITNLIDNFIEYCNNKDYDKAYDLLSTEFRNKFLSNKDDFIDYVDKKFKIKKIYNIQNYSNIDNAYVYRIRLMEDILESGTSNGYQYLEEKYVVKKEGSTLKLALDGYVKEENLDLQFEDENMKMSVTKKDVFYDRVYYYVEITNKTDNYILLANQLEYSEILLDVNNEKRDYISNLGSNVVILKHQTTEKIFEFEKYVDELNKENRLIFDAVRILPTYSGNPSAYEKEKENATKLYSITFNLSN